jgi:enoyl-CoA hydratase
MGGVSLVASSVAGEVARLRLTRPDQRNALSRELVSGAVAAIDEFVQCGAVVAVLEADPPVFCAGNDLEEMDLDTAAAPRLLEAILTSPLFWIAAVNGPAYGAGVAVVACCPVVLATERAVFELPEWQLGLFPAPVVGHLEAIMGPRAAFTAALSGAPIAASDAVRFGLATELCSPNELDARVQDWIDRLIARPAAAHAARDAWQTRFRTLGARDRLEGLQENMRDQLAVWPGSIAARAT